MPKERKDRGKPRRLPLEVADVLLATKENELDLTVPLAIKKARATGAIPDEIRLPESTVYKLFARHGLTRKKSSPAKDHRRFAYQYAGDLFMSDVIHGPAVKTEGGRKRKIYLIAFIDDTSRVIPYAAFALSENTASFMTVFKEAVLRRGIPIHLFVDNGSAFRSQHLALVCAKRGITLIHTRAYPAEAKGKFERWIREIWLRSVITVCLFRRQKKSIPMPIVLSKGIVHRAKLKRLPKTKQGGQSEWKSVAYNQSTP